MRFVLYFRLYGEMVCMRRSRCWWLVDIQEGGARGGLASGMIAECSVDFPWWRGGWCPVRVLSSTILLVVFVR